MEDHQYTALSWFTIEISYYTFSLISCTHELWIIRLLKIKQKEKTTNPRLQDLSAKKIRDSEMKELPEKQDFKTHQQHFRDFNI